MAEVTNELIFETLKAVHSGQANLEASNGRIEQRMSDIEQRLTAVEHHIYGLTASMKLVVDQFGRLDQRLTLLEVKERL